MSKLADIRNKAKASTAPAPTGKVLPDLSGADKAVKPIDDKGKDISAQTNESRAQYFAAMATAPTMPDNVTTDAAATEWFTHLNHQQQAAYRFEQEVEDDLDKADMLQTAALRWYFKLLDIYTVPDAKDASKTVCLLDEMPVPDSKTGNNPAIKEEQGRKKDGTSGMVKVDFFDVLARALTEGKELRSDIESLQAAAPAGNAAKVKPKHAMLTEDQRTSKLTTLDKRWQRFRSTIKDAFWIRIQWAAIKSMAKVELDYVYDQQWNDDGTPGEQTITKDGACFCIWDKLQGKEKWSKTYTVANFLKLDVAKANKAGGTVAALVQSVAKGTGTAGGSATPTAKIPVLTVQTLEQAMAEVARFFSDDKLSAALLTEACKPNAGGLSDDYVLSLGKSVIGLDMVWKHIKDRYTALTVKAEKDRTTVALARAENVAA